MEGFGETARRGTFDSPEAQHGPEGVRREPLSFRLALKMPDQGGNFLFRYLTGDGDEDIGLPQVAVVFGDFVFQHEMVAKRVPSEVGQDTMVLVPVFAVVGQHQVRLKLSFDFFKGVLDGGPMTWKITILEVGDADFGRACSLQKLAGALFCLARARPAGTEYKPKNLKAGLLLNEPQH